MCVCKSAHVRVFVLVCVVCVCVHVCLHVCMLSCVRVCTCLCVCILVCPCYSLPGTAVHVCMIWDCSACDVFYMLVANRRQMWLPPGSLPSKQPFLPLVNSL